MSRSLDIFGLVAAAPSLIVGLGISRLMADAVTLFRSRAKARLGWMPLVWAGAIFLIQIQFLWAVIELHAVPRQWSLLDFFLLLGIAVSLYLAAALVLPDLELAAGESLEDNFMKHGRWALVALAMSEALAFTIDLLIFDAKLTLGYVALFIGSIFLPLAFLFSPSTKPRKFITVAYFALIVFTVLSLSPKDY